MSRPYPVIPAKAGVQTALEQGTDSEWTPLTRAAASPGGGYAMRGIAYLAKSAAVTVGL